MRCAAGPLLIPLMLVASACGSESSSSDVSVAVSTVDAPVTEASTTLTVLPRDVVGSVAFTSGRGGVLVRESDRQGAGCGVMLDSGAFDLSDTGTVTVIDRAGTIIGAGEIVRGALVSASFNPDGTLAEQVCDIRFRLTLFEPVADLATVEFAFDGRSQPFEVRVLSADMAADLVHLEHTVVT